MAVIVTLSFLFSRGILPIIEKKTEPEPKIITTSQLQKVINISDLSSYQCVYNDICTVYTTTDDNKKEKAYYCSYEATVNAGINFEKVKIGIVDKNEKEKIITVTIPKVEVGEPVLKIESIDYMFIDKKFNTSGVIGTAYKACIDDVRKKSQNEEKIYELAQENAENIIKALIMPFVEDLSADGITYTLEIKSETEATK